MRPKLHFPGLNGVRFLAAMMVIVDHTEEFKLYFGGEPLFPDSYGAHLGSVGVTVFFALSGFLITRLLLSEQAIAGTVNVGHFYLRRVLRIWPVYYLCTVLSFFVFPYIGVLHVPNYTESVHVDFVQKLVLFVFLLPNVAFITLPTVPFANVLWSVGVEEQFYLFWPLFVRRLKHPVVTGLALYFVARAAAIVTRNETLALFLSRTRFSCMLIGAGAAYLLVNHRRLVERFAYPAAIQIAVWSLFLFMVFGAPRLPYPASILKHEVIAALAVVLIVNVAQNAQTLVKLENGVLDHLGKLSYGLYVYHLVGVVLALNLLRSRYASEGVEYAVWSVTVHVVGFCITLAIAHLSYRYLEQPFLQKKQKFSTLLSGDQAHAKELEIRSGQDVPC